MRGTRAARSLASAGARRPVRPHVVTRAVPTGKTASDLRSLSNEDLQRDIQDTRLELTKLEIKQASKQVRPKPR